MILHLKQFSEIHFENKIDVEGFQILMFLIGLVGQILSEFSEQLPYYLYKIWYQYQQMTLDPDDPA